MKILVMTPYAPHPPNSGGRMRIVDELRFLSQRHQLTLVSFYQLEHEYPARTALNEFCERVYYVPRPVRPVDTDRPSFQTIDDLFRWHTTVEMAKVLAELQAEAFDLLILHHIFMAQYAELFAAPAVLEEHNIESNLFEQHARLSGPGAEQTYRRAREMVLRRYETTIWKRFALRVVVSQHDQAEMARRCTVGRTLVVENGINTHDIAPLAMRQTRTVLFMGSLDFYPNIDALLYLRDSILPCVWALDPTVSLIIAGRRPPRLVRDLAADPRIRVMADPQDMRPIAEQCALTLVPMRIGSGTRIKILHAMAFGLPIVTTTRGCEGLQVRDDCELLIRDEPDRFGDAVLRLLDEPLLADRMREAGRTLVETRYDSTTLLDRYEEALIDFYNHSNL